MEIFKGLQPELVWSYFEEICKIPRPSKKEEKIAAWLMEFAKKHQLEARQDEAGNVLITKPATPGKEQTPGVVLQAHMDMVCEKNADTVHDFDKDPIKPYIDGEWVKAKGTTLGADDGIGIAAALAVLTDENIQHGPLECLFTVDEETGLTGAFALQPGFFQGNANCKKGFRPSFIEAGAPDMANELYEYIIEECKKVIPVVERGNFGADMKVSLLNDGPFTIVLDSEQIC